MQSRILSTKFGIVRAAFTLQKILILLQKYTPILFPPYKTQSTHLFIFVHKFFAQRIKIGTIHRWNAYEIIFLTICDASLYNFFLSRVKILQDYDISTDYFCVCV